MLHRKIGNYGLLAISKRVNKDKYKSLLEIIYLNRIFKRSHNSSEIQKHGKNGSFHTLMKMKRKMPKLSLILTCQDQFLHHSFSKKLKSLNSLETLRLGNNGSSHISMKMRRKTSKLSLMLTCQDMLMPLNFFRRSRFHNSLETQMHGESGFFLTSKKTNKTAYKSCFATISQDKLLSQSVNKTYRSLVRCKDRRSLVTIVDG